MKKILHSEMIQLTAMNSRRYATLEQCQAILESYTKTIEQILLSGGSVKIPLLGTLYPRYKEPQYNRRFHNCHTAQVETRDYLAHNVPVFKPSSNFVEKMKKKTWGNPF